MSVIIGADEEEDEVEDLIRKSTARKAAAASNAFRKVHIFFRDERATRGWLLARLLVEPMKGVGRQETWANELDSSCIYLGPTR